jgi:hypothetical protein
MVYVPGKGFITVPYNQWMQDGWLSRQGRLDVDMMVYNTIHVGDSTGAWMEPMFNSMMWEALETGKRLVGAEIGVHRGDNAKKILTHLPIDRLYLIDPYDENPDYQPGNPDLKEAKRFATERLAEFGDRVFWVFERSEDALPKLHDLDFVYHDSDHRRANVEKELPLGYDAVKSGGWWGGHDYKNTLEGECAVKSCVDEFVIDRGIGTLYYSSTMLNWWTRKV